MVRVRVFMVETSGLRLGALSELPVSCLWNWAQSPQTAPSRGIHRLLEAGAQRGRSHLFPYRHLLRRPVLHGERRTDRPPTGAAAGPTAAPEGTSPPGRERPVPVEEPSRVERKGQIAVRRLKWIIALPVVALLLVTAGTWTYIHVLSSDAPARLTLGGAVTDNVPATTATTAGGGAVSAAPASFDGTWTATTGTQVETAAVSIDLGSVTSDRSQRDGQFRNRIMDVTRYPTATFTLTQPIDLGTLPADGATITVPATGDLTLHGTKRAITTTLSARRTGGRIEVNGTIPVTFADYNIPNPSFGPAQTEDHGDIEFLIAFAKSNT